LIPRDLVTVSGFENHWQEHVCQPIGQWQNNPKEIMKIIKEGAPSVWKSKHFSPSDLTTFLGKYASVEFESVVVFFVGKAQRLGIF